MNANTQKIILNLIAGHSCPIIIIGLSGGADSVFLFRTLVPLHHEKKISLHALHINHGWRETAHHDEEFCRELARAHTIPFISAHMHKWTHHIPAHKKNSGSKEADAREARRIIFDYYKEQLGASFIALAHHADDQIETFFIRLIRGTGLTGLCSMKPICDGILRPLLNTRKTDILTWLSEHNQSFCIDETNESMAFLRNRIRAQLLPILQKCDARATDSTVRTIEHLQQEEELLTQICTQTLASLHHENDWYNTQSFLHCASALRARILTTLLIQANAPFTPSESLFTEIERFLSSPRGGTHTIAPHICVGKKKQFFSIKKAVC